MRGDAKCESWGDERTLTVTLADSYNLYLFISTIWSVSVDTPRIFFIHMFRLKKRSEVKNKLEVQSKTRK
jgi:hypothetical protein